MFERTKVAIVWVWWQTYSKVGIETLYTFSASNSVLKIWRFPSINLLANLSNPYKRKKFSASDEIDDNLEARSLVFQWQMMSDVRFDFSESSYDINSASNVQFCCCGRLMNCISSVCDKKLDKKKTKTLKINETCLKVFVKVNVVCHFPNDRHHSYAHKPKSKHLNCTLFMYFIDQNIIMQYKFISHVCLSEMY